MKKINAINSLILIVLILLTSFSSGCGGGGGGSVSSPGGGAGSGPSITLEGEIDPVSLGIDVSAFSASGRSFAGAADLSQFSVVVLENKAYMDFRRSIADSAASSMSGYAYSPSFQESGDFGSLLNSGAVIASSDKINAVDGKLNYAIDIPINDNAPDATIALVDKNTGMAMLSAPLGCLPDKSFFASDSGAAAASGVSRPINYGYGNLIIKDFEINSQTTVLSMANIENNISSNINFFSSAVKKIAGENTSKNKVFSSKDSAVTNISTVKKVVGAWFKDTSSVNQFSNAVTTVNKVFNSNSVPKDNQKTLASLLKSKTSLIGGTLDCFTNCIKNDSIVKSVVNLTTSINIGGTVIDSRSSSTILNKVFSKITSKPADLNPPRLKSVTVSPSAAAAGETVTLSIKSDMPLAAEPAVYMFGRKAAVYKISDSEYAARVDLNSDDKTFSFSINPVIGMNGKTSLGVIGTTTDASKVTILQSSAIAATAAEPPAGTYDEAVKVVLATKTPGAFIRYTTDGTTPSVSVGTIYQDGILVNSNMVINAVAVLNGSQSLVMTASYRIMTPPPKVSAPSFNIAGGSYNRAQTVAITTVTPGASIRYTLDGTAPAKTNGILYSAPVAIKESAELNAAAFADNMSDSSVTTAYYEIDNSPLERVAAPVIRPAGGVYDKPQAISISCATPGVSIRYTLDGSVPSFSEGSLYSSSFMLDKSAAIKAIAFKTGMGDSDIATASFEITGEAPAGQPSVLSEMEPRRDGSAVNSDFDVVVAAASGWRVAAAVSGVNALDGVTSVTAVNNMAVLPVAISKLVEGATCEIKITAAGAAGESKGELSVRVKKDTIAPRRYKLSAASSNSGGPSIAELGDRIVISLSTDEPVKNLSAVMMNKPVTIRNTDSSNWTVARYLDGSEDSADFDFIINFTDLAGNKVSYPLTKKDINEGEVPVIKKGPGNSSINIFRKEGVNKLFLSAVPAEMEYCLDGVSEKTPVTWYDGAGVEVDLSAVAGSKYIFVRQKGFSASTQCLGKILAAPAYGIDEFKSNNRWAFDASTGAVILTGFNDGVKDLDESMFSIHIYSGASTGAGTLVMQYYIDKVEPGSAGKVIVPSYLKPSWTGGEFVSFYLKSNNGTPYITEDDIYIQPAAGVAVKSAPLNSSADGEMNFIFDGRSNQVVFQRGATALAEITPLVSLNGRDIVRLDKPIVSGASRSFELPFQPAAGAEISVSLEYKDGSVSGAAKFTAADAPANMAEGFGNFSVKALLGQIAITNFDSGRDGYTAFASTDNGLNWKELGKISANVGQNFNITMTASSRIKLAMRDKNGNFSRTQPEGISIMPAPVNAAAGDKAFLVLGHEKKLEVDNSNGALNGFNLLYSLDGGASWSSTEAVAGEGRRKLTLPELIRSGSAVKIALLEWKTGNASLASPDYLLKSASNRLSGAVAGDFTVNAALKKVAVNNSGGALTGYTVYVNGAEAGKISAGAEDNAFAYEPGASDEVELYYAEPGGNTWLSAKSKPVMKPRNNKITDGDFFVNAAGGKIVFKNSSGKAAGLVPLVSTDGGKIWKDIGPAIVSGDNEFALKILPGDKICAAFGDSNGNISAASEFYNAVAPKLNTPVKMLIAGDGGADAKAGVITEAGKPALTLRPGVMLNSGENLKVTLSNGGAVAMTAKSSLDGAVPVFGGSTPGIIYEAGAPGNGNTATGSFNLNNPGGVPVAITGTVEVAAVYSDALGNTAPESKAYIAADTVAPLWAAGYPAIAAPEYFKLKISLMTNEDGKIYIVCLKSSEAAPTAAQVKAGQNASGATVAESMKAAFDFTFDGGVLHHTFEGLDNNTEYAVYAVAEDGYENLQTQPAVVKFKTLNNVAPVWASGYPKAEAPEFFTLKFSVKNNETGSVYLLCQKSGLASLTAAQVKAGVDASGAAADPSMKSIIAMHAADSEAVHIFTGLENAVEYDIYAVAEDEYGALQANPTSVRIKTRDNTPPSWASGYPQAQPTGYTSLRLNFNVDKKAVVYALCLSAGAPEPSAAQIIGGRNASDVELASNLKGTLEIAANTSGYINFSGLGVGTPYDVYAVAENEYKIAQPAVSKTRAYTIALVPPSVASAETSADGTKILVKFNKIISSALPAAPAGFSVACDGSANTVTAATLNSQDKSLLELTLTNAAYANVSSIKISYAAGGSAVKCLEGLSLSNFTDYTVINKSSMPPVSGLSTSVADGAVTLNWVKPSGDIFDGFVISYTDITAAADPVVLAPLGNVSTHTVSGLVNGHIYTFTVKTIKTTDRTKDSAAVESRQSTPTSGPVFSGNAVELIKNAGFDGGNLKLTSSVTNQNGVAVFKDKVDVTRNFTVDYTFEISEPVGGGADGIIFMVTKHSPAELTGYSPPGNGWLTSYINNCFYVDFDTYKNDYDEQAHSISIKYPANQRVANGDASLQSQPMTRHGVSVNSPVNSPSGKCWLPTDGTNEFNIKSRYVRIKYIASTGEWKVYYSRSPINEAINLTMTDTYKLEVSDDNSKIELVDGKYLYVGVSATTGGSWSKHSLTSLTITNP